MRLGELSDDNCNRLDPSNYFFIDIYFILFYAILNKTGSDEETAYYCTQ
jgi:hypothetical protein